MVLHILKKLNFDPKQSIGLSPTTGHKLYDLSPTYPPPRPRWGGGGGGGGGGWGLSLIGALDLH